jgi:hypothetical protein
MTAYELFQLVSTGLHLAVAAALALGLLVPALVILGQFRR